MKNYYLISMMFILFNISILSLNVSWCQELKDEVVLTELTKETQVYQKNEDTVTFLWWIPTEYWRIANKDNPLMTDQIINIYEESLKEYILIAALEGVQGLWGIIYTPYQELEGKTRIIIENKEKISPLKKDNIPIEIESIIDALKPMLSMLAGQVGENMHFFLFPARDKKRNLIASPLVEGSLEVQIGNQDFKWKLPLASLVEKKKCPVDGELLNGNWKYCPWHGTKLEP